MDGFLGYNQIAIKPTNQHKTTIFYPWGIFSYRKLPFDLTNVGATFKKAMDYAFHDIDILFKLTWMIFWPIPRNETNT